MTTLLADHQLKGQYRELSTRLRRLGHDKMASRRVERMMLLEEEMRHRGLDPDKIAREVEAAEKNTETLPELSSAEEVPDR